MKKLRAEQKIKAYLDENGITQAYISNKTKISAPKLNLSLNGKRKLSLEEYELICGALNVNTDKFLKMRSAEQSNKG